ncbi:hypothetical protein BFL40_14635 [Pseudomonas costantinii]|nr:hypothetical protein BFL40_14635 [Pseudomonas costantinii]
MMRSSGVLSGLDSVTVLGVDPNDKRGVVLLAFLRPFMVRISAWLPIPSVDDPKHIVKVFWRSDDGVKLLKTVTVGPPPGSPPDFYDIEIDPADVRLRSRTVFISYSIENAAGLSESSEKQAIIDLDAPQLRNQTKRLSFVNQPTPAVDRAYLNANPRVAFNLSIFDDNEPLIDNVVEFYLSNQATPPVTPADGRSLIDFSFTPWRVMLDAKAFEKLNDGNAWVFYKVLDKTGNASEMSDGLPFTVALVVVIPPVKVPAPTVQHTLTNGYLTARSVPPAVQGVCWLIAPNSTIQQGDVLTFKWQGFSANNWSNPIANVVFTDSVTWTSTHSTSGWTVVVLPYQTTLFPLRNYASATGTYEVRRGGVLVAESLVGRVRTDLTYATGCYATPLGIVCDPK